MGNAAGIVVSVAVKKGRSSAKREATFRREYMIPSTIGSLVVEACNEGGCISRIWKTAMTEPEELGVYSQRTCDPSAAVACL